MVTISAYGKLRHGMKLQRTENVFFKVNLMIKIFHHEICVMKNTDEDSILLECIRQFFRKRYGGNQEDSLTTAPRCAESCWRFDNA